MVLPVTAEMMLFLLRCFACPHVVTVQDGTICFSGWNLFSPHTNQNCLSLSLSGFWVLFFPEVRRELPPISVVCFHFWCFLHSLL